MLRFTAGEAFGFMSKAEDALSEHLSLHVSQHFTNQVPKVGRLKEDIARSVATMVHNGGADGEANVAEGGANVENEEQAVVGRPSSPRWRGQRRKNAASTYWHKTSKNVLA